MSTAVESGYQGFPNTKDVAPPSYNGTHPRATSSPHTTANNLELQFKWASYKSVDIAVSEPSGKVRYYAEMSEVQGSPDVVLRERSKGGQVIGTAHFHHKHDVEMTLGADGSNTGNTGPSATLVNHDPITFAQYTLTIPRGTSQRVFDLVRTSSKEDGVKGSTERWNYFNYKITDRATGKSVGAWLEHGSLSFKVGKLKVQVGAGGTDAKPVLTEEEVWWIVMAMASVAEKARRRAPYAGVPAAIAKFL